MTRKDYVLIAEVLKGAITYEKEFNKDEKKAFALQAVAHTFSNVLANENPRFDRARFLSACGVM